MLFHAIPLDVGWEFRSGELLSCRYVDVIQVLVRKRVLVEGLANSSSQGLAALVTVFKAFELVVDAFGQTAGHRLTARNYFTVGHDLPQIVFG
jgi:hypothetical protein